MAPLDLAFGAAMLVVLSGIAVVDFRTLTIPDTLNALLAALGFSWAWLATGGLPLHAAAFAICMAAGFWLVRLAFRLARGVTGLGLGDVKLAGAAAFWFSPWNTPAFLFFSAFSALLFIAAQASVTGRLDRSARVPFGPFIGFGLLATWLLERSGLPSFIPQGSY